ncbi:asparaginyl-tRNA synthetase [Dispira parvispora]|uniref:Asparagine--tRNA ligase, mitochondrial n=1 Tax=Dispira parvispora TaxID=1520584 RepID=A0A9W8E9N5_9FUNG|nr:asparaginyl-tRNA synthetase [Dispira parvispora]
MLFIRPLPCFPSRLARPGRTTLPRHPLLITQSNVRQRPLLCGISSTRTLASDRTATKPVNATPDRSLPVSLPVPTIRRVLASRQVGDSVDVSGWVRSVRRQKARAFIELCDGSSLEGIQIVLESNILTQCSTLPTTGTSVRVQGILARSPGGKQTTEIVANEFTIIGECDPDSYPLQKKYHSIEFLRSVPHLRPRTRTFTGLLRLRDGATRYLDEFFANQDFVRIHTPILTSHDCEGGGEVFKVVNHSQHQAGENKEFFQRPVFTTVSAQLHAEIMAHSLSRVYTFNPTFRAEPSMTYRHLAEFWMLEAEMAFITDVHQLVDLAESMLRHVTRQILDDYASELVHFQRWVSKVSSNDAPVDLEQRWRTFVDQPFARMTYTEAVEILQQHVQSHPGAFTFPVEWGKDLQHEHEQFLADHYCQGPVFVTDYPSGIKAFYMQDNPTQQEQPGTTSASVDLLVPGPGELLGGSLREHRFDALMAKLQKYHLDPKEYEWYTDLRRYGSVPHGGFGLGFDRYIQMLTGIKSIRDIIPFARYSGHCHL